MAGVCAGGHDGSERQVDASGGEDWEGDGESGSQGASGGQGRIGGQRGVRRNFQAGGGIEAAVAEDDEAVKGGAAIGIAGRFPRRWSAAGGGLSRQLGTRSAARDLMAFAPSR
jgi:hypothetical protein